MPDLVICHGLVNFVILIVEHNLHINHLSCLIWALDVGNDLVANLLEAWALRDVINVDVGLW